MPAWLLAFFTVYLAVAFVLPTARVRRRDGVNALAIQRDDSAHGVVGRWFAAVLIAVVATLAALALGLDDDLLGRLGWAEHPVARAAGAALLAASLILVVVAQARMGKSWRIGIDLGTQPPLVRNGPFAILRNPIFLGMRLSMLGLFLALPNAATLATLLLAEALMQIQVRLEEAHLTDALGADYEAYVRTVPRWW